MLCIQEYSGCSNKYINLPKFLPLNLALQKETQQEKRKHLFESHCVCKAPMHAEMKNFY